MTRVVPAPLLTVLQGSPLAGECLILAARDGTRAGFTTLDRAQTVDLGLGAGPETCASGMVVSAITLAVGLDASTAEIQGPLGPVLTREAVEGGRWTDAEAWLVRVAPGSSGFAPLLAGKVSEPRVEDPRFVLEIRNQADALNQPLERLITGYCRWRYGDPATCGATVLEIAAEVTAVTDTMRFTLGYAGTYPDGTFTLGEVEFTSGALDGVISEKLFSFVSGGAGAGSVVLREPLPEAPAIGDVVLLRDGCALTRPACMAHQGNATRFGGEPDVPGSEQIWKMPVPGTGA